MAQPPTYNRETDFTDRDGDDTNHEAINAELDGAAQSINAIRDNLALIQADDGGLAAGIVGADQLNQSALNALMGETGVAVQDALDAASEAAISASASAVARDSSIAAQNAALLAQGSAEAAAAESQASADAAAASLAQFEDGVEQAINGEKNLFIAGVDYIKGVTTQLTLSAVPAKVGSVRIFYDGLYQNLTEFSLAGAVLNFTDPILADEVEVSFDISAQYVSLTIDDLAILQEAESIAVAAQAASQQSEVNAEIAEDGANLARIAAEAAAAASLAANNTYADVAAGLAGTVDGDVFLVVTSDPQVYSVYDNQAGVGVLLGTLNIADSATFNNSALPRGSVVATDTNGRIASFIGRTGEFRVRNIRASRYNGLDLGAVARGVNSGSGTFGFDTLFLDNTGQSLGQASVGGAPITRTQEGNGFAYPYGIAAPAAGSFLPAISTDANVMGLTTGNLPTPENPMFGMIGFLRELLARENGVLDTSNGIRIGTANNARGSAPLVNFDRALTGTGSYALWYQQAVAAKAYADANGERLWCAASHLIQGESDFDRVDARDYWYNKALIQAQNRASDMTALGVAGPLGHRYLIYQMCQRPPGLGDYGVTRAQYELAKNEPNLITLTAPNYFFNYMGDITGVHIMTEDAKWLGGYAALAIKRLLIDRVAWGVPVATPVVIGNSVILEYSGVRQAPFVIDTTTIPVQPGFGWKAFDNTGAAITINSVTLAGPTGIRLNLASTPGTGWRFRYAQSPTTNRLDNYVGGCGNIRDSHGNNCIYEAINKPMHNWLPAHDVTLA